MLRSIQAVALATWTLVACAQTSQAPPTTTAPVVSASAATDAVVVAPAPAASLSAATPAPAASTSAEPAAAGDPEAEVAAQFRACKADADCLAVPRAGCCDNGRKVPVAASQKDAYAQANACTRKRPICPMFRVRDRRVAYCDAQAHQCALRQP